MAFRYLDEFNHVVAKGFSTDRIGGKPENFIIEVGEQEPRTFLNSGEFFRMKFSTHSDVENALELVRRTLKLIDDSVSLQTDNAELLTIIRDEICNAVAKDFDNSVAKLNIKVAVDATIKDIFNYYIGVEKALAEPKAVKSNED